MKLSGIEIRNYRSIGDEPVVLKPWKKCNILIGQNNSGKSNIIRAVQKIIQAFESEKAHFEARISNSELHRKSSEHQFMANIYFLAEEKGLEIVTLSHRNEFKFAFSNQDGHQEFAITAIEVADIQNNFRHALDLLQNLLKSSIRSGGMSKDWLEEQYLHNSNKIFNSVFRKTIPSSFLIPVFRQIQHSESYEFDGRNLIGLLGQYQHPDPGNDDEIEKFEKIQEFTRRLLHLPDAKIEVTHDKQRIMIQNDGLRIDLDAYGTGVHELIILVTAILSIENAICCIEEPEIHLHPALQREFIRFLVEETSNQYLISTHSPTFINAHVNMPAAIAEQIQVFHVQLKGGATVGHPVLENTQSLLALNDLGVHASDILQSNCVIWVEGPSDRVYLNRWLSLVAPDRIEGLHYSIMFYGGRLLSHLSVTRENSNDKVPEELIDVLRINQNAVVIMDSDRKQSGEHLNPTKRRVRDECEKSGGLCWVTDGREIENYLPPEVLGAALGVDNSSFSIGTYDKLEVVIEKGMKKAKEKPIRYASDKVGYARDFIEHFDEIHIGSELRLQLKKVVDKINDWNDM